MPGSAVFKGPSKGIVGGVLIWIFLLAFLPGMCLTKAKVAISGIKDALAGQNMRVSKAVFVGYISRKFDGNYTAFNLFESGYGQKLSEWQKPHYLSPVWSDRKSLGGWFRVRDTRNDYNEVAFNIFGSGAAKIFNRKRYVTVGSNSANGNEARGFYREVSGLDNPHGHFGVFCALNSGLSLVAQKDTLMQHDTALSPNSYESTDGGDNSTNTDNAQNEVRERFRRNEATEVGWRFIGVLAALIGGIGLLCYVEFVYVNRTHTNRIILWSLRIIGGLLVSIGFGCGLLPIYWDYDATYGNQEHDVSHGRNNVTQKLLTIPYYCNTLIAIGRSNMANLLSIDKQVAIISALAEGSSIRSIERMAGVHRDTIMRLGVRVGKGSQSLMDAKMRELSCQRLQFDEVWGFIGKKEKHVRKDDDPTLGDVWTWVAIDADTKLVPTFKVGKRDHVAANAFVADVASRMANRVQISTDGLRAYVEAIEASFGSNVDYAQIVKVFESEAMDAEVIGMDKTSVAGRPDMRHASTSYVERLNGTTRQHMRRLTRLTYAFSKKFENFEAAVGLHFAYYNFVKRHNALRATPAMAAGIERDFWTVGDLVEAVA
jgi:IS1 family transposase